MKGRGSMGQKEQNGFKEIKIVGITNFSSLSVPRNSEKYRQPFCKHMSSTKEKNNTHIDVDWSTKYLARLISFCYLKFFAEHQE